MVVKPFMPLCKPGGHGAIWKLAYDKGVFQWFFDLGRKGATVRQVRLHFSSISDILLICFGDSANILFGIATMKLISQLFVFFSNVVAATDVTLLALSGIGIHYGKVERHF